MPVLSPDRLRRPSPVAASDGTEKAVPSLRITRGGRSLPAPWSGRDCLSTRDRLTKACPGPLIPEGDATRAARDLLNSLSPEIAPPALPRAAGGGRRRGGA